MLDVFVLFKVFVAVLPSEEVNAGPHEAQQRIIIKQTIKQMYFLTFIFQSSFFEFNILIMLININIARKENTIIPTIIKMVGMVKLLTDGSVFLT